MIGNYNFDSKCKPDIYEIIKSVEEPHRLGLYNNEIIKGKF